MRFFVVAAIAACGAIAGCASKPFTLPPQIPVLSQFDPAEADRMLQPGPGVVKGSAFLRQQGGGVVTCAGSKVLLVPATKYAQERIGIIYGAGALRGFSKGGQDIVAAPPEYWQKTRETRCDAQGNFQFENVADGSYYIVTSVGWVIGGVQQGGGLMEFVQPSGGRPVNVVMTQ